MRQSLTHKQFKERLKELRRQLLLNTAPIGPWPKKLEAELKELQNASKRTAGRTVQRNILPES